MKALAFVLIFVGSAVSDAAAQHHGEKQEDGPGIETFVPPRPLEFNRWSFRISNYGSHAFASTWDAPQPLMEGGKFPKGTENFLMVAGGFSLGVLKDSAASDPELRYAVSHFDYVGDFAPGPILNSNVPFDSLNPDEPLAVDNSIYIIDTSRMGDDWINWPWQDGAPWDSSNGEPLLVSQEDSWAVYNDADTAYHCGGSKNPCFYGVQSPIPGIGVEIRQTSYEFGAAENTVLLRWKIINHTNTTYDSAYFSTWTDTQIGERFFNQGASNEAVGTDTVRNMMYGYNIVNENDATGNQYAVGYKLLYFSDGDGIDSKLYASSFTGNFCSLPCPRFQENDVERYHFMRGLDLDGTIRLASELLVETDGSKFVFPGDPVTQQGLLSTTTFFNGLNLTTDLSVGPFILEPGVEHDVIFAFVAGEAGDRLEAITDMRREADELEVAFDNYLAHFIGVEPTITPEPLARFTGNNRSGAVPLQVRFTDYSLADPNIPIDLWQWDFDNDGTIDSQERNPTWTYVDGGRYSPKLIVSNATTTDTLVKEDYIEAHGLIGFPFSDDFPTAPQPDTTKWITSTVQVSNKGKNEPSPPYSLALDSHPHVTSESITSFPFDLGGFSTSGVVLTYSYEGKGESSQGPESEDSLFVELKNSLGEWIRARSYPGESMDSFAVDMVELNEVNAGDSATFYCPGFQFRFRNLTDEPSGAMHRDVWFIDDVDLDLAVGIGEGSVNGIPRTFKLHQNYPNPFNPTTTIKYDLPRDSKVTIKIYNVLGQAVKTLVDEPQTAGFRSVVWNGKNDAGNPVSSGVYVYRIEAEGFVRSKKMMLLR